MDREITPQQAPAFRMDTCGNWTYLRFGQFAEKGRGLFTLLCRRFGVRPCPSPDQETLDEMRSIWRSANEAWENCRNINGQVVN